MWDAHGSLGTVIDAPQKYTTSNYLNPRHIQILDIRVPTYLLKLSLTLNLKTHRKPLRFRFVSNYLIFILLPDKVGITNKK